MFCASWLVLVHSGVQGAAPGNNVWVSPRPRYDASGHGFQGGPSFKADSVWTLNSCSACHSQLPVQCANDMRLYVAAADDHELAGHIMLLHSNMNC